MRVKEESEKVGLELNIQKMKIIASGPRTSRQIGGKKVEIVTDFILGGSKMTVDSNCSYVIKRCLLLGRKAMTNLDSILKSRDITLLTKFCVVKAIVFPVLCWRRLLRVPWTASRSNQSIVKEISPEYSLEGLLLKLKLQYLGHLIQRANSLEKILMPGKTEGRRRRR